LAVVARMKTTNDNAEPTKVERLIFFLTRSCQNQDGCLTPSGKKLDFKLLVMLIFLHWVF